MTVSTGFWKEGEVKIELGYPVSLLILRVYPWTIIGERVCKLRDNELFLPKLITYH